MHSHPPPLEHPLLLVVLIVLNIPFYIFLWRMFFDGWQDFFNSLHSIRIILYSLSMYKYRLGWKWAPDDEVDSLYPALRLLAFALAIIAGIAAEYHVVAWLLSR